MADATEVINASTKAASEVVSTITSISYWIQAFGVIAILWVLYSIVMWFVNRKNHKRTKRIEESILGIEETLQTMRKENTARFDTIEGKLESTKKR